MRRFSQRTSLVTLSEINITPLLDLAFVLLIIFVITRPLLEQNLPLQLPQGGGADVQVNPRDVRTVEVTIQGDYYFGGRKYNLAQVMNELVNAARNNPNTVVYIRADENGLNKHVYAIIDACQKRGITRFSLRTSPPKS